MARYAIEGPWTTSITNHVQVGEATARIAIEYADLKDTRCGAVYTQGAYRVRVSMTPTLPGQPRTKTFKGETAWSASERYAEDARWFFRRQALNG